MTAPSLSDKVQCIKRKLHSRFRKQKEKHQLQINGLNYKMNGMKQSISELNVRMESKRDEVETYKSLLCQIRPYQEQYHKLQVSYQQVLDESHQIKEQCRDELNAASLTYQVTLDCRSEEIETLTQRVGEMQEIEELNHKVIAMNQHLEHKVTQLNEITFNQSKHTIAQTEQMQALKTQYKQQTHSISGLKQTNETLRREMIRCDAQITRLQDCLIAKFDDLNRKYNQKMDELNAAHEIKIALSELYRNSKQQNAKQSEQMHVLWTENEAQTHKINELIDVKQHLERKVTQLNEAFKTQYKQQTHSIREVLQEKDDVIVDLKQKNETLRHEMMRCDSQIARLKDCLIAKFDDLNTKYNQKVDEINAMTKRNEMKHRQHVECVEDKTNRIKALEHELTSQQETIACHDEVHNIYEQLQHQQTSQLRMAKTQISELKQEVKKVQNANDKLNNSKNSSTISIIMFEDKISLLQQQKDAMQSKFSQIIIKNTQQYDAIIALQNRNRRLKEEMTGCDAQITRLEKCLVSKFAQLDQKYDQNINIIKELEDDANTKQHIIDCVRHQLSDKDHQISSVQSQLNALMTVTSQQKDELKQKQRKAQQDEDKRKYDLMTRQCLVFNKLIQETQIENHELVDQKRKSDTKHKELCKHLLQKIMLCCCYKYKCDQLQKQNETQANALKKRIHLMCLNMEQIHKESFDYVQKTVSLRDENMKLKKENRKMELEIKHLHNELQETKAQLPRDWSLATSCAESMQSNHGMYYDADGNATNVEELKLEMEDGYAHLDTMQCQLFDHTKHRMNAMYQRMHVCADQMEQLNIAQTVNQHNAEHVQVAMSQLMDISENIANEMKQRLDGMLTLFEIRCDGMSQNVRLIKHALDNKRHEELQLQSVRQHAMEKRLYELQFQMKITRQTFQKMRENVKYAMQKYEGQYTQTQTMIAKAFMFVVERFKQSLGEKNAKIYELESRWLAKRDRLKNKIKLNKNDYKELQTINARLEHDTLQQEQRIKDVCHEMNGLKRMHSDLETQNTELRTQIDTLEQQNEESDNLQDKLKQMQRERDQYYNDKQLLQSEMKLVSKQLDELNASKAQMAAQTDQMLDFHKHTTQLTKTMQQRIEELELDKRTLEQRHKEETETMQTLLVQGELQTQKLNELQSNIDDSQHIIQRKTQEIEALTRELEDVHQNQDKEWNELHSMLDRWSTGVATQCSSNVQQIKIKITHLCTKESEEYKREMNGLRQQLEINATKLSKESNAKYDEAKHEIERLKQSIESYEALVKQLKPLQDQHRTLQSKYQRTHDEYEAFKTASATRFGSYTATLHEMNARLKQMEQSHDVHIQSLQDKHDKVLQEKIVEMNNTRAYYENQLQELQHALDKDLSQKLEGTKSALRELESLYTNSKQQHAKQSQQMNVLWTENEAIKAQYDELLQENHALVNVNQRLEQKVTQSNEVALHQRKHTIAQTEQMQTLLAENDALKTQTHDINEVLQQKDHALIELKQKNEALRHEMIRCDAQITRLKHCLIAKFDDLNDKYNQKTDETNAAHEMIKQNEMKQRQHMECINDKNNRIKELEEHYVQHHAISRLRYEDLQGKYAQLHHTLVSKNDHMERLYLKINDMKYKNEDEKAEIRCKLETLSITIHNKLDQCAKIIQNKDDVIREMDCVQMKLEDEIEVLQADKYKLESDICELNRNLHATHSKHRYVNQSLAEYTQINKKLQLRVEELTHCVAPLQAQITSLQHEKAQIYRHRDHVKDRCEELKCRLKRYKEKFKSVQKECTLLAKKNSILDQLVRVNESEIGELQFEKKSGTIRENIMCDMIRKGDDDHHALHRVYEALLRTTNTQQNEEDSGYDGENESDYMKQRIQDLKAQCNHYQVILRLDDDEKMDFKQQTALYAHQILEHWTKTFNKFDSMIQSKAQKMETMQNALSQINIQNNKREMIELKRLLHEEIRIYRSKLQTFYTKYRKSGWNAKQDDQESEMGQITKDVRELCHYLRLSTDTIVGEDKENDHPMAALQLKQ